MTVLLVRDLAESICYLTVRQFEVSADIFALGDEFKFEIIARTASGNNAAIETCFTLRIMGSIRNHFLQQRERKPFPL